VTNYKFKRFTTKSAERSDGFEAEVKREAARRKAARRKVLEEVSARRRLAFKRRLERT